MQVRKLIRKLFILVAELSVGAQAWFLMLHCTVRNWIINYPNSRTNCKGNYFSLISHFRMEKFAAKTNSRKLIWSLKSTE